MVGHPLGEDRPFGARSVRYQVARYCDYLDANPWSGGDPLRDARAHHGAVKAYEGYLRAFDTSEDVIRFVALSLDHFHLFLGILGG